jgi:hypothetical protein
MGMIEQCLKIRFVYPAKKNPPCEHGGPIGLGRSMGGYNRLFLGESTARKGTVTTAGKQKQECRDGTRKETVAASI